MNACVDCKHHTNTGGYDLCHHPDTPSDPVTGVPYFRLCRTERHQLFGACGRSGVNFAPLTAQPVEPETYLVPTTAWQCVKVLFVGVWQRVKAFVRRVWPW